MQSPRFNGLKTDSRIQLFLKLSRIFGKQSRFVYQNLALGNSHSKLSGQRKEQPAIVAGLALAATTLLKKQPLVVHGTTGCVHRKKISRHRGDSNFRWAIRPTICSSIPCHQPTRAHDVCRKGLGKNISLVRTDLMATHRYPATKTKTCRCCRLLQFDSNIINTTINELIIINITIQISSIYRCTIQISPFIHH
jgi:hypothetical protein